MRNSTKIKLVRSLSSCLLNFKTAIVLTFESAIIFGSAITLTAESAIIVILLIHV
ncbi:MAG: hypothetical protein GPJ17_05725 [Microcystis aeruginosa K13-07]|nr:hypothetical protein [Microcystis aeruginosa K13-07]